MGRVLHGKSFEPVENALVSLFMDGEPVRMIDDTWENPYLIVKSTRGGFSFMPEPQPAESPEDEKLFSLEIRVEKEGFEPLSHYFDLSLSGEKAMKISYNIEWTYKTDTLYLFPEGESE